MIIEKLGNECLSVMNMNLRHSGIGIIEDVPWGTHFCQFYQTTEDLIDILVPYFKTGLENNEFCMWVTSQPLEVEEAKEALRKVVPDIDVYLKKGQLEIISYSHWYVKEGAFDSDRVLNGWVEKLNKALANGYDGLRSVSYTHLSRSTAMPLPRFPAARPPLFAITTFPCWNRPNPLVLSMGLLSASIGSSTLVV